MALPRKGLPYRRTAVGKIDIGRQFRGIPSRAYVIRENPHARGHMVLIASVAPQSLLSASIGSTLLARRAGM